MKKKILFVCLGNICRSPAAEAVFLFKLRQKKLLDKFEVDSAGTGGWHAGNLADSRMRKAALERGIRIESIARQITLEDFSKFDLILTMDNSNLKDVNDLSNQLVSPCKAQISPLVKYARNSKFYEVPDPYYGGEKGFDDVLDLLEDAINGLISDIMKS